MKLKVTENYDLVKDELQRHGIEITDNSNFVLIEDHQIKYLTGKKNDEQRLIDIMDIYYIESFDHDIILHTHNEEFKIKENLTLLESMLPAYLFIRINNSTIINIKKMKEMTPLVGQRIKIKLSNQVKVYVTRTYFKKFRGMIGF